MTTIKVTVMARGGVGKGPGWGRKQNAIIQAETVTGCDKEDGIDG